MEFTQLIAGADLPIKTKLTKLAMLSKSFSELK